MKDIKAFRFIFLLVNLLLCSNIFSANVLDEKYKKAGILIDENRYKEAILLYKGILKDDFELDYHKKSRVLNNIGYCYYKQNDLENACDFYRKALEIDSNYFLCVNNISAVLIKQKKYKEALFYLSRAHELDNKYIKVIFNFFVVYANLKNKELARYYLEKAFEIDKDYTIKRLKKNNITDKQIIKIQKYLNNS